MQANTIIPIGWSAVKLGDIGTFSKGAGISKADLSKSGNNAIRYAELYTKHNFRIKKIYSYISDDVISSAKKIKYGDILFAGSGETIDEIGKSAAYLIDEPCYVGGDTIIFSPKQSNSLFLSFLMNSGNARKQLRELGQGQSVVHIYKRDLEKLELILPPLPEQNSIVIVLETWDKHIEKLSRKIATKQIIKKGLMQKLLTGQVRLPGFSEPWEIVRLSEVCTINPKNSSLPDHFIYIDLDSVEKGVLIKEKTISLEKAPSRAQRKLKKGDILFQMVRPYQRNNLYFAKTGEYVASTGYAQIRANNSPEFLYYKLHTDTFVNKVLDKCTGSNYPAINSTDLSKITISIPLSKEQIAIANILTTTDKAIEALEKKLVLLEDQKKYLLNNLITGKIRVSA